MASVTVDRNLFGLVMVVPADQKEVRRLLHQLPTSICLRPAGGVDEWIVALHLDALPTMRRLYRMKQKGDDITFTHAALEALAALGGSVRPATPRTGVEITPAVIPALRGAEASTDPTNSVGTGPQESGAPTSTSSEETL